MAILGVSSSCTGSSSGAGQDLQVRQLKSRIDDWSSCPTTDPQTKRSIVGRLQAQLDIVTSSIQAQEKAKENQAADQAPGLGSNIDINA